MLRRVLVGAAALSLVVFDAPPAHAEDPDDDIERADGSTDCRAFRAKNELELAKFEKGQPPTPYKYPREQEILNAPWGNLFGNLNHAGDLLLATILPHVGAQFRGDAPAAVVAWPWSILVFGPMYSCTRHKNTFTVHGHRVHRMMLEPIVVSSKFGVGFSTRVGYRFIWHPTSWVVGPGVGFGSTVDIAGAKEKFRASLSPEILLHFGNCCDSSYFTFSFRYDHYFNGTNKEIFGGTLGYVFF